MLTMIDRRSRRCASAMAGMIDRRRSGLATRSRGRSEDVGDALGAAAGLALTGQSRPDQPHQVDPRQPIVAQVWEGLNRLLDPIYSRVRQLLPRMSGIDLAPLVVLLGVYAVRIVLMNNAMAFM